MPSVVQLKYIDLFAGCGGLSLGLHNAGWRGLFAVEKSADAFSTLKYNLIDKINHFDWPKWLEISNYDVYDLLKSYQTELRQLQGKVPLVVGGPPCQGFSLAGDRNKDDARNKLFGAYLNFVRLIEPETLLFENVHGFTLPFPNDSHKEGLPFSAKVTRALQRDGYAVESRLIDLSEYGVPQRRTRFILVASKVFKPIDFFEVLEANRSAFLREKNLDSVISVRDAIGDLLKSFGVQECPDSSGFSSGVYGPIISSYQELMRKGSNSNIPNSHRFSKHRENTISLFKQLMSDSEESKRYTPESFKGLKKRGVTVLKDNSICTTITSIPDDFVHYCEPRIPTVREQARFQSFPDWFEYKGKYTTGGARRRVEVPRYTQVANAIPPLFAEQMGIALKEMMASGGNSSF